MPRAPPQHRPDPVHGRQDDGFVVPGGRHLVPAVRTGQAFRFSPRPPPMPAIIVVPQPQGVAGEQGRGVCEEQGPAQVCGCFEVLCVLCLKLMLKL